MNRTVVMYLQTYWQTLIESNGGLKGILVSIGGLAGIVACLLYIWHGAGTYFLKERK